MEPGPNHYLAAAGSLPCPDYGHNKKIAASLKNTDGNPLLLLCKIGLYETFIRLA